MNFGCGQTGRGLQVRDGVETGTWVWRQIVVPVKSSSWNTTAETQNNQANVAAATDLKNVLATVLADDGLYSYDVEASKQLAALVHPRTKSTHNRLFHVMRKEFRIINI